MTGIPISDLPPEIRRRLVQGNLPARRKKDRSVVSQRESRSRWLCKGRAGGGCGEPFTTYAAMDRHMHATGHARFELELGGTP